MSIRADCLITSEMFNSDPYFFDDNEWVNCGSFALNLTDWYYPYARREDIDQDIADLFLEGYSYAEVRDFIFEQNVATMKEQFGDYLIPIDSPQCVDTFTDVVAFRVSLREGWRGEPVYDFHFKVRRDGDWLEKCGMDDVRECKLNAKSAWDYGDDLYYDSPIAYFAINSESEILKI